MEPLEKLPTNQSPSEFDIFVKVFVSLASSHNVAAPQSSSMSLEWILKLAAKKGTTTGKQNQGRLQKALFDNNLPVLCQVLAAGVTSGLYTLERVDQHLSSLTFRLFTLFLQHSKEAEPLSAEGDSSTDLMSISNTSTTCADWLHAEWCASPLEVMKTIHLLSSTRPISLSTSFVKHLYPYINQVPRTAKDADLISEVWSLILAVLM